jgi:hypothetical protein
MCHFIKILFLLSKWFQKRRFLWEFPIGSYVKLSSAVAAILVEVLKCRTHFWKRTTQESFQQSLVEIGSVVSEENIFFILRWSPFKSVSVSAVLYPRWPPLLKIEISSNGQNCSILSQNVPKFELLKHNDELLKGSFRQNLVEIGLVVSNKKIFK